uniref:LIM homeobox 2b n=1 Tax=Callorhinchus milii TaxID=7868 RepID=A0A4W3H5H5_CALMI
DLSQPTLCAGCGGKISDRYYLLAVDKQWHMRCLKCCECKLALESELTCFAKDGSIYCKEDYYRRFAVQRCARCHLGISASEMVMRARDSVYHLNCFTCHSCNKALSTGDHFGMKDSLVYYVFYVRRSRDMGQRRVMGLRYRSAMVLSNCGTGSRD